MKTSLNICFYLSFLCAVQLQSTATTPPHLPEAAFADTEVSTNVTLSTWSEHVPTFRISVSLDATPSNNVQIAIGEDVSGDGSLMITNRLLCSMGLRQMVHGRFRARKSILRRT